MLGWRKVLLETLRGCPEELREALEALNEDAERGEAFTAPGGLFALCSGDPARCRAVVVGGHCADGTLCGLLDALAPPEERAALGLVRLPESFSAGPAGPHDWSGVVNALLHRIGRANPGCRVVLVGRQNWPRAAYLYPRAHTITKIEGDVRWPLEDLVQDLRRNTPAESIPPADSHGLRR